MSAKFAGILFACGIVVLAVTAQETGKQASAGPISDFLNTIRAPKVGYAPGEYPQLSIISHSTIDQSPTYESNQTRKTGTRSFSYGGLGVLRRTDQTVLKWLGVVFLLEASQTFRRRSLLERGRLCVTQTERTPLA